MTRLAKLYAANIVTTESTKAAGDNLKDLRFDNLDQEHIRIGRITWVVASALKQEQNTSPLMLLSSFISKVLKDVEEVSLY